MTIEYKNLTKDSVTLIAYEDDASIVYEARTPEGWGLTVNNYVDLTPAIQQTDPPPLAAPGRDDNDADRDDSNAGRDDIGQKII